MWITIAPFVTPTSKRALCSEIQAIDSTSTTDLRCKRTCKTTQ
ncbi:hypothetical protein ECP02994385_5237 [Escherichia coli P0299438.5]|nr:hypothetical protein ECP029943811_5222 [Escherichia coli P0299438.11]ENC01289.1 hypothetical protein ECP02994383_1570 [Escherichia coli P0299438.3]ENC02076.1 hypothetical protein ECP02994385_5237 [Escherichia coli P0299438.5]ENC07067.1 hypothetical protein ECP02994386_5128 [Escherichia coli P0299438.6]ENC25791.1 hypothetical protein ECP02994388_1603 [Escherichia coli P0299438.8]